MNQSPSIIFADHGIEYEVVNDFNEYDFNETNANVKIIFIETPSNPLLEITDIKKVSQEAGIDSKLLRLAIGVEHEHDILEDISNALEKAKIYI